MQGRWSLPMFGQWATLHQPDEVCRRRADVDPMSNTSSSRWSLPTLCRCRANDGMLHGIGAKHACYYPDGSTWSVSPHGHLPKAHAASLDYSDPVHHGNISVDPLLMIGQRNESRIRIPSTLCFEKSCSIINIDKLGASSKRVGIFSVEGISTGTVGGSVEKPGRDMITLTFFFATSFRLAFKTMSDSLVKAFLDRNVYCPQRSSSVHEMCDYKTKC